MNVLKYVKYLNDDVYESSNAASQEELRNVSDNINLIYTNVFSYYITVG